MWVRFLKVGWPKKSLWWEVKKFVCSLTTAPLAICVLHYSALLFSQLWLTGLHREKSVWKVNITLSTSNDGKQQSYKDFVPCIWWWMAATYLPPTLFRLKVSSMICTVAQSFPSVNAVTYASHSVLPFDSCPFLTPLSFYPPPFRPPQHMLGLHTPSGVSRVPLLLASHWVGWQERTGGQQEVGRACQNVLPPHQVTGTSISCSVMGTVDMMYREDETVWEGQGMGVSVPCVHPVTVGSLTIWMVWIGLRSQAH